MINSNYTILIVEDELDLLDICVDVFEIEGFKVLSAKDGKEGLRIFLDEEVDLVLSDSSMPTMDGIELLEEIQKSKKKSPPFFLLTGDIELSEEALKEKGATGLLFKPYDLDEVIDKVTRTLAEL